MSTPENNPNKPQVYGRDALGGQTSPAPPVDATSPVEPKPNEPIREINLDEAEFTQTQDGPQDWTPSLEPNSPQASVTEIDIDDEAVSEPTESFKQIQKQVAPENQISPETGISQSEAEINDEEQQRQGGGEVILSTVSTYQDAIQEALRTQSMSSAKVLMAEQKRREIRQDEEERDSIRKPINKLYLVITIFFVVLAVGAIGAVSYFNSLPQKVDNQRAFRDLFFEPDSIIELPQASIGRNTILKIQQVLGSPTEGRGVHQVIVTKEVDGAPDSAVLVTANAPYTRDDFFSLTESRITDDLRRSLNEQVFLGIESSGANEPFMIFKVENYDLAFSGMLAWERTLIRDMSKIFSKGLGQIVLELERRNAIIEQQNNAIRRTSSTAPTIPIETITSISEFGDEVISNTDARVIKNEDGATVFFYTFINNEYLFFGTSPRSLTEVQKKIRSAKLVL